MDRVQPLPRLPTGLWCLLVAALALQALDVLSGVGMMHERGLAAELNPLARAAFGWGGPLGALAVKAAALATALPVLVGLAHRRHAWLAAAALLMVAAAGLLGLASNLA